MRAREGGTQSPRHELAGRLVRTSGATGVGMIVGALGGYVSLVVMVLGVIAAAMCGVLLVSRTRGHRAAAGGGFLLGLGLTAAWLLSPALSNRDPAVTYDPSTLPALIIGLGVAFLGLALVVGAVGLELRRHHEQGLRV